LTLPIFLYSFPVGVCTDLVYIKLGTIFPIVFAVITGAAVRRFAAWKLERGVSLGLAEQLMASLTVGGTVMSIFTLRTLNLTAFFLVVVWSASPLGSQSSLLMIRVESFAIATTHNLTYLNTIGYVGSEIFIDADTGRAMPALNGLYNACLLEPGSVSNSSQDLWGNVKIPDIAKSNLSEPDGDGWMTLRSPGGTVYSSLIGIPVTGLPSNGTNTFNLEVSYLSVSVINSTGSDENNNFLQAVPISPSHSTAYYYDETICGNATEAEVPWTLCLNGFYNESMFQPVGVVANFGNGTLFPFPARTIIYQSEQSDDTTYATLTTAYVETTAVCLNGTNDCSVTAMRQSTLPHPNSNYTDLSFSGGFGGFVSGLLSANGYLGGSGVSSLTELYLAGQLHSSSALSGVTPDEFSAGLEQVINTYWFGSYDSGAVMSGSEENSSTFENRSTTVINTMPVDKYVVRWQWFSIYLSSALIMVFAALSALALALSTRGPDILGYVSTSLINSLYVDTGHNVGSTMSGTERALVYGKTRLRLVDIEAGHEVGYITTIEDNRFHSRNILNKQKYYK
jgi:hypothetical protein